MVGGQGLQVCSQDLPPAACLGHMSSLPSLDPKGEVGEGRRAPAARYTGF